MRNFLSREQALEARARLDATHAERMRSSTAPRWNRPAREDGSEFNQTEVLRLHSRYEPGLRSQLWHGAQRANSAGSWGYSIAPLPRNVEALQFACALHATQQRSRVDSFAAAMLSLRLLSCWELSCRARSPKPLLCSLRIDFAAFVAPPSRPARVLPLELACR